MHVQGIKQMVIASIDARPCHLSRRDDLKRRLVTLMIADHRARAILIDAALKCPHVAELISFHPL